MKMNLRELIKTLSNEKKTALLKTIDVHPDLIEFCQYQNKHFFGFLSDKPFEPSSKQSINNCAIPVDYFDYLANDYKDCFIKRGELLEVLKGEPEYTLDKIPPYWFVNTEDANFDELLFEQWAIKHLIRYFRFPGNPKIIQSARCSPLVGFSNITNLFLKKPEQPAAQSSQAEPELSEPEIIEIDNRRYRKIDTQGKFENGDLLYSTEHGLLGLFIGYNKDFIVYADELAYYSFEDKAFKLEEIKPKIWHYAIYEFDDKSSITQLCEFKSDVEEIIANKIGVKKATYLTYEQL